MRHLHFGKLFFVVFSLLLAYTVSARKPIKTLLITGQNNHNWQVSHVVLNKSWKIPVVLMWTLSSLPNRARICPVLCSTLALTSW